LFALLFALLVPDTARAHGMSSAYLEVTEIGGGRALVRLTSATPTESLSVPTPVGCRDDEDGAGAQRIVACDGSIEGRAIEVRGLGPIVSEVVVQVTFAGGASVSRILTRDEPNWLVPRASSRASLAFDYARLGLAHIFGGVDHLLFLAALALSVRKMRAILLAETAFTASHSLTFTASALGWVHVSSLAAEACIAMSLVLVALDAARAAKDGELVPTRRAAGLAFAFGLVHGLGFAGGLAEIGLPDRKIGWALLGFAGGVETGQVVFLVLFVAVLGLVARARGLARAPLALAYAVGVAGAFLLFERLGQVLNLFS
jgi:hypothetical protein